MKWVAISGSWRRSCSELERDVRQAVAKVMQRGDGIITGGALGVDYVATVEALKHDPSARRIRVIIPSSLDVFAAHYRQRATEGVITSEQAESLISLLEQVKLCNPKALIGLQHDVLNETTYYDRNSKVLEEADELLAFQVNGSLGTQDTINKAQHLDLIVTVKRYKLE